MKSNLMIMPERVVAEVTMPEHVFVSGIIAEIIGKLDSSALKEIKWIRMVKHELKAIHETLIAINRVLLNAQEQQSTNMAIRKWLQDLKHIAVDIEDEIDLILTQHALSLKVKENGTTLYHRFSGSRKPEKLKALGQRLRVVDHGRKQFNLQEQPRFPQRSCVLWFLVKELREKKSWDEAWNSFCRECQLRDDELDYKCGLPLVNYPKFLLDYKCGLPLVNYPKFLQYDKHDLYRVLNCRFSERRRR